VCVCAAAEPAEGAVPVRQQAGVAAPGDRLPQQPREARHQREPAHQPAQRTRAPQMPQSARPQAQQTQRGEQPLHSFWALYRTKWGVKVKCAGERSF
jgi:hypothetical protein